RSSGLAEPPGDPAALGPQPPRQRHTRQPTSPPPRNQRIRKRIPRRIRPLTRIPQHPRSRREHHERRQIPPPRHLIQHHRPGHLRRQHPIHPRRIQPRDQTVLHHTGRMHHHRQPIQRPHQRRHRRTIGHISRHHPHPRPQRRHPPPHPGRITTPRHQHHIPHPMHGHQMTRHQPAQRPRTTGDQRGAGQGG